MSSVPVIDAHVHVWDLDPARYPWQPILGYVPDLPATPEALVQLMNVHGVDGAVLVQPSVYGWDHRYLLDALARLGHRFRGVGLLDHEDPHWHDRLLEAVDWGFTGVRFNLVRDPGATWIMDACHRGLWSACAEYGLTVCFQARYDQLADIGRLAGVHGDLVVVVDHLGKPSLNRPQADWREVIRLADQPGVHLKLSSFHHLAPPDAWDRLRPLIEDCVAAYGSGRLLWGSDVPGALKVVDYGATMAPVRSLQLPALDREAIMGGTAARLFRLEPAVSVAAKEAIDG